MHSASMPRRDRKAARPSVLSGGHEKRNRALREACTGDGSSVSCGGARGAGAGSVSAAVGRPGGCAASAFPGWAGAVLVSVVGDGRHGNCVSLKYTSDDRTARRSEGSHTW
eukprot:2412450-Pleurochrysis_carterae.AAC.3